MKSFKDCREIELAILSALPHRAHDLARLRLLADRWRPPVVTVVGKYNHGKSRLLNELIGRTAFSVADKRETVALSGIDHDGVRWLDAPGLDADVGALDDQHARQAIWLESDIRLFVHALKEGELDASELALMALLRQDQQRTSRHTVVILSQADQLADDQHHQSVMQAIERQLPGIEKHPVSSTRHRQGIEGGKALLLARSGIPALQAALRSAIDGVSHARGHEATLLQDVIRAELEGLAQVRHAVTVDLQRTQTQQRERFDADLAEALDKAAQDIQLLLDTPGPDHSLNPDSFAEQFNMTPGKLERNRLQVGYSRVCIDINAVLIRHGVSELPVVQRTSVQSLDNVMVAVMGVYVKYRKDLKQIFFEPAGRERMRVEFTRYFELSSERVELVELLASAAHDVEVAEQALVASSLLIALQGAALAESAA